MTIGTLIYALVFGSLVAIAAGALDACLRLGKRAARGVWVAALGVTLAGTAAAPARTLAPSGLAPVTVAGAATARHTTSLADRVAQSVLAVRSTALRIADRALARIPTAHIPSLDRWVAIGWLGSSLIVLALLIAVHAHFRRARRAWPLATVDGTRVRLTPSTGPAVMGAIDAEIVVPAWLVTRASVEQRLVLDHEREHLRVRDPLLLSAGYVAAALLPWHPAVWWMLTRLRLAVELDCDARVLHRGTPARSYGELLIALAGRDARAAGAPVLGLTLTHLERRLIAMTPHRRPHSTARRTLLAAAAFVAFAIACNAPVPTSPHQDDAVHAPLGDVTRGLSRPGVIVLDHIDGQRASKLQADSLRIGNAIRYKLTLKLDDADVRKRVEYWLASDMAKQRAAGQLDSPTADAIDPNEAHREKILVDSAQAAMIHAKRSMGVTDQVLIDGRPATILSDKHFAPDRIMSVDVIEHAN
ncbi:MAG TPA: M56 family metallopeptidase, partial [Gemmatimonadaceae bacterium]